MSYLSLSGVRKESAVLMTASRDFEFLPLSGSPEPDAQPRDLDGLRQQIAAMKVLAQYLTVEIQHGHLVLGSEQFSKRAVDLVIAGLKLVEGFH